MKFDEIAEATLRVVLGGGTPTPDCVEYLTDVLQECYREGLRESERVRAMMDEDLPIPDQLLRKKRAEEKGVPKGKMMLPDGTIVPDFG